MVLFEVSECEESFLERLAEQHDSRYRLDDFFIRDAIKEKISNSQNIPVLRRKEWKMTKGEKLLMILYWISIAIQGIFVLRGEFIVMVIMGLFNLVYGLVCLRLSVTGWFDKNLG